MANRRCGEVAVELGGERYTLCLTLGALAELEDAFGVDDLPALAERFAEGRLSSRDLVKLLAVSLRGGGHALSMRRWRRCPLAASRRSRARSETVSWPLSGAPPKTLRHRRTSERAFAVPMGRDDGFRSRRPAVEPRRVLGREPARAHRGGRWLARRCAGDADRAGRPRAADANFSGLSAVIPGAPKD